MKYIIPLVILILFLIGCSGPRPDLTEPQEPPEPETQVEQPQAPDFTEILSENLDESTQIDDDLDDSDVASIEDDMALIENI